MAKKCPPGKYYCFTDKKCKKIPRGYHIGARGYLARGDNRSDSGNGNGNGNGSSNGNGNGGNGAGNGNGGSGGNGGGNGGGGMGESIIYEKSNPRIPRKAGQPAKSKKHSDLYTDEDPKGTIHGLGFKDVAKAKASVSKIRNSSRSHAHKIQAAVAMEQRAREMGKTSEAAVYRKYINSMKKKTKKMNEEKMTPAEKRKDTMLKKKYDKSDMKKSMQKQYGKEEGKKVYFATIRKQAMNKEEYISELGKVTLGSYIKSANIDSNMRVLKTMMPSTSKAEFARQRRKIGLRAQGIGRAVNRLVGKPPDNVTPLNPPPSKGLGIVRNKDGKGGNVIPMDPFREETDKYNVSEEGLRAWFGKSSGTTKSGRKVKGWVQVGGKYDGKPCARQPGQKSTPKCVSSSKRRSMSKSERDSAARRKRAADPNQPQKSGAAKPTNVSTDPKRKMKKEEYLDERLFPGAASRAIRRARAAMIMRGGSPASFPQYKADGRPDNSLARIKELDKQGGRLTDMARGKYGKMTGQRIGSKLKRGFKDEASRQRAQNKARQERGLPTLGGITGKIALAASPGLAIAGIKKASETEKPSLPKPLSRKQIKKMYSQTEETMNEAKDKKGKGSGTKDACYHKVKSRYSVWPSAYASGALVKCRKVGAANWGNKTKKEGFSPMQVAALEGAGMIELNEAGKKCWKGYKKAGTQKLFGKTYNRCVKAGDELNHDGKQLDEKMINVTPRFAAARNEVRKRAIKSLAKDAAKPVGIAAAGAAGLGAAKMVTDKMRNEGVEFLKREKEKKKSKSEYLKQRDAGKVAKRVMAKKDQEKVNFLEPEETNESKTRLVKNGHTYKVVLTWRGKTYMVQMFVPSVSRPTRQQIEQEIQKLYPDAKVMSFLPRDLEPGEPTVMMGEEKRDEYGDIVGGPKISKKEKAKNLAKNEKDEQHTTTTSEAYSSKPSNLKKKAKLNAALKRLEDLKVNKRMSEEQDPEGIKLRDVERIKRQKQLLAKQKQAAVFKNKITRFIKSEYEYVAEDDMKGMSVKSGHKRPTKSGAGMTQKGVEAYRRRNPGSKLKTAVTGKVKKGSKDAKRRKSYCARSAGQMKKFPKAAKDPNSRLRQARRRWKC